MTPVEIGTQVREMVEDALKHQEATRLRLANTSFITGSHAYGTPHEDSDVDLVVRMPVFPAMALAVLSGANQARLEHELNEYQDDGSFSMRFGKLNLICCYDDRAYANWLEGTSELSLRKPVTRGEACATFQRIRKENKCQLNH